MPNHCAFYRNCCYDWSHTAALGLEEDLGVPWEIGHLLAVLKCPMFFKEHEYPSCHAVSHRSRMMRWWYASACSLDALQPNLIGYYCDSVLITTASVFICYIPLIHSRYLNVELLIVWTVLTLPSRIYPPYCQPHITCVDSSWKGKLWVAMLAGTNISQSVFL